MKGMDSKNVGTVRERESYSLAKNKKGITLVALVITIVLLLILAEISIAQLTGSGLFENARLAQQKSKEAQEKEEAMLGEYENMIDEFKVETITGTRDSNLIKVTGTTPTVSQTWVKIADYPEGYNKDNLFVKFFRIKYSSSDWSFSYRDVEISLQDTGIWISANTRLSLPIEVYLEELKVD